MLALRPSVPIYLHAEAVDMRKSFDGLFGIIKIDLERGARDGGLFMFLNHLRNRTIPNRTERITSKSVETKPTWLRSTQRGVEFDINCASRSSLQTHVIRAALINSCLASLGIGSAVG